jgi:RNA polymerase sigma factor (sigma-70 family)
MAEAHPDPILRHVRHLIGGAAAAALTDGQLLERFLDARDEAAVEALVRRHGPLVFGACRRVLRDGHAAEDAFQATFLVLVRKAPALDRGKPLGAWLYTVAYRLALRARANELRRRRYEDHAARARPPADGRDAGADDLAVALEEELHRLPERHRAPLVLCYLEGKTNEQAAAILGCPRGSMAARLDRARERLREGLERRGFVAPAAALAAALAAAGARAAVPLALLDGTARAALWFAGQRAGAAVVVSTRAVALARGAFRAMFFNRLKVAGALLLAACMLGTGTTLVLRAAPQERPPARPAEAPPADRPRAEAPAGPDRGANAALQYGQAYIALRRVLADPPKLYAECLTMPLDAHARDLVAKGAYALRLMRRGAAQPDCDWGVPQERGVAAPFTHGDGSLVLASLACLRARLRFEEGQAAEAVEDLVAARALARHVSRDGTLDGLWGGYQIEDLTGQALARSLPRLDDKAVKDLRKRLDALPPGGSTAEATARMEASMLDWIVGELQEAKDRESLVVFLGQLGGFKKDSAERKQAVGRALLEKCGGTAEGVLKFTEEVRRASGPLAKTMDLPPGEAKKAFERDAGKLTDNPVFGVFGPVLENIRVRRERAEVRRALLAAALAVRLDGQDALKDHPDPVAAGPFEYESFDGGFELRSRLRGPGGQPLTLTVGRRRNE